MRVVTMVEQIASLSASYDRIAATRPGVSAPQTYDIQGVLKAANALGERVATMVTSGTVDDDIPF